jgi:tetratricopeptide (TPR) repeat protein
VLGATHRDFSEAVRLDPAFRLALMNRANSHQERGDHHRAVADYNEVIRQNPRNDVAYMRRSESWLKQGDTLAALRDADAVADLRQGLTLKPNVTRKRQIESALREMGVEM